MVPIGIYYRFVVDNLIDIPLKTILITGTSKGIGKELAIYYLEKSFQVIGIARSVAAISHPNYTHYICDIGKEKEVTATIKSIKIQSGSIDILINNAAMANMNHLLTTPFEAMANVTEVNFFGTFLLMREVGKQMIKQNFGRIINFTTISAALNLETQSVYAATKAAVESLTKTGAKEFAPFNITVNAIGPAPMDMGLVKGIPEHWINNVIDMQTIKRKTVMSDITHVTDFYISDQASFITGQVIYLGGIS